MKKIGKVVGFFINKYRKSHSVELADALIAACVKVKELKLWTLNKKHYPETFEKFWNLSHIIRLSEHNVS